MAKAAKMKDTVTVEAPEKRATLGKMPGDSEAGATKEVGAWLVLCQPGLMWP